MTPEQRPLWFKFPAVPVDQTTQRIVATLIRFLQTKGGKQAKKNPPNLLLFTHPFSGIGLSADTIKNFGLPSRKIILIQPRRGLASIFAKKADPEAGLFRLTYPLLKPLKKVDQFLRATSKGHFDDGDSRKENHPHWKIEVLLKAALGDRLPLADPDFWENVVRVKRMVRRDTKSFKSLLPALLKKPDLPSWRYALHLLTCSYSIETHAWHSRLDLPFQEFKPGSLTIETEWKVHRFLEVCRDLAESLQANLASPQAGSPNKIVLIDDRVAGNDEDKTLTNVLGLLGSAFLKGWDLDTLNPLVPLPDVMPRPYEFLRDYSTVMCHSVRYKKLSEALSERFRGARFILVDQLFKYNGSDKFDGPFLIRGLSRFFRDVYTDPSIKPPEIIALSRTGDTDRIMDAFRAGAKDYVLKSRLLALPAVLARVSHGTSEPLGRYHHNFRALYNLPNETVGLLRAATIPGIAFHGSSAKTSVGLPKDKEDPELKRKEWFAKLIRALPKTDLHVHIGSCMSPEFLVVASLVLLARRDFEKVRSSLKTAVRTFHDALDGRWEPQVPEGPQKEPKERKTHDCKKWIADYGKTIAESIKGVFPEDDHTPSENPVVYREHRAILHTGLGIPDYLKPTEATKLVEEKPALDLVLFAIRNAIAPENPKDENLFKNDDLIRICILVLASKDTKNKLTWDGTDLLAPFRESDAEVDDRYANAWRALNLALYNDDSDRSGSQREQRVLAVDAFRGRGWRLDPAAGEFASHSLKLTLERRDAEDHELREIGHNGAAGLEYTLATGLRSHNLTEYLEGCRFSGAEHLRHPFLIHLYAQQAICDFIRKGAFYVELRGSPDGYVNSDLRFEFPDAIRCLVEAFSQAQEAMLASSEAGSSRGNASPWVAGILGGRYEFKPLIKKLRNTSPLDRHLPCKVSLLFSGKRHKPIREMILEAAASAVMKPAAERKVSSAADLVAKEMARCRVVGFDLAGEEHGAPPGLFTDEFSRLSKLHIPLTIHAGENASAEFIEDAILKLGARRIGHGLSLAEDRELMGRVREERVCIELCPVSNHQTSHFGEAGESRARQYPLKSYLQEGILVTIGTDNPFISDTNLVREYFQASHAYDKNGLPLWEALRIMRMGFVASFLNLPERRAMLELVDQILFDLFSKEEVVTELRRFGPLQPKA
jgi:adenosine deaminase